MINDDFEKPYMVNDHVVHLCPPHFEKNNTRLMIDLNQDNNSINMMKMNNNNIVE